MNETHLEALGPEDRREMLMQLGLPDIEALFAPIPAQFRLSTSLDLPEAIPEWSLRRLLVQQGKANADCQQNLCFLGAGVYDHHVPAAIDAIAARGEFLTAYTPYQPEMSQGLLGALEAFASKISAATNLPVVTSSHYDGATALAEACWMAVKHTGRTKVALSSAILPQYREVINTYSWGRSIELVELSTDAISGRLLPDALSADMLPEIAAIVMQTPNALGLIEDQAPLAAMARDHGVLLIGAMHAYLPFLDGAKATDGFDIITFEGQPLGLHMFAGGAHLGILACTSELRRWTPGRLIGKVSDIYGNPALALVYEDREQHVARDRATSNICSNQALNAIRSGAFMSLFGAHGIASFANRCVRNATTLRSALAELDGIQIVHDGPIFNEFVIRFASPEKQQAAVSALAEQGIFAGVDQACHPGLQANELLVAVTETRTPEHLLFYVMAMAEALATSPETALKLLNDRLSVELDCLRSPLKNHRQLQPMPEIQLIRQYTAWSRENFGVDTGSYPLGSCTMKYNPKRNDAFTEQTGFQALHPFQPSETLAGLARIYDELRGYIAELIGMDGVDLTPAAGAHGELKGLMVARRYFEDRGELQRKEVIIPDSAHGTNPATATMVGFKCRIIPTRPDGLMDADALRAALSEKTAVVMTTNPSTFGVFEEEIGDIIEATHAAGALLYYDGANMNALMGHTTPGLMGFDIAHINVHKTLSTPHGGGGPGAGPIGVKAPLVKYISQGLSDARAPDALRTKLYFGHISVLLRAYCYIRTMGPDGLRRASSDAVLNANYLMRRLEPIIPPVFDRLCMHEALLDGSTLPISTFDLAKRMIDFEVHPPTLVGAGCVYFGEALNQAMLFEPTETETKADLDRLVDIIFKIVEEAKGNSNIAASAPLSRKVARVVL
ncbi:MAG: aminomethyl-transferring glycine dehydrogenase subunit GcvPB [Sphingorhabdus sp.]